MIRDKSTFGRRFALNQGLRFIHKCVRQGIAPHIAHRKRLAFAFQHKIYSSGHAVNTSRFDRSANPHMLSALGALQTIQLCQRMVISLALAVAEPRQARHRNHDDPNADSEFGALLHPNYSVKLWIFFMVSQGLQRRGQFFGQQIVANFIPVERFAILQDQGRFQIRCDELGNEFRELFANQHQSLWLERSANPG